MKRLIIFICFLSGITLIAQNLNEEAREALKNKNYNQAIQLSKSLIEKNNPNDALKILIQIREEAPHTPSLFETLGDAYNKMNVAELALDNYESAEKEDSLNVNVKFKSAEILYKNKRYTDAVNKYLKIISIDTQNPKAYKEASNILFQAKLYNDASIMLEKYILLEPTEEAYQKITKSFLEIKNYQRAYEFVKAGLQKYPESIQLKKNGAIASFGLKKYQDAGNFYASIPDSNLTTSDLVNAGKSFQISRVDSVAIKYFEKAVKKDSTLSNIFMDLANYYYRNNDYDSAIKYYAAKTKSDPAFEPAYKFMAFAMLEKGNNEGARQALLASINLADTSVTTHYWLGQVYIKMDSLDQASSQFIQMLSLVSGKETKYKNETIEANAFLGQRAFNKEKYNLAIPYLRAAINLKPDAIRLNELLALSYHQSGNINEAIQIYKKILVLAPKNEIAKKGLRMLSAD